MLSSTLRTVSSFIALLPYTQNLLFGDFVSIVEGFLKEIRSSASLVLSLKNYIRAIPGTGEAYCISYTVIGNDPTIAPSVRATFIQNGVHALRRVHATFNFKPNDDNYLRISLQLPYYYPSVQIFSLKHWSPKGMKSSFVFFTSAAVER